MGFIPCPGVAQAVVQTNDPNGDIQENKFAVYNGLGTAWSSADLQGLADTIDTWITTGGGGTMTYLEHMTSVATVIKIHCRDLTTHFGNEWDKIVSHAGGGAATYLPTGVTKALTLRTYTTGRSFRGRIFMPCCDSGVTTSGLPDTVQASVLADWVGAFNALMAAIVSHSGSWYWGVLSQYSGVDPTTHKPIPRAAGFTTEIREIGYSHTQLDYQRRRAPFHGRHG